MIAKTCAGRLYQASLTGSVFTDPANRHWPGPCVETDLEIRRKRLKFRAWHRGMREVDLILGSFADMYLDEFDSDQLGQFERIIDSEDPQLYGWIIGKTSPGASQNTFVMRQLLRFKYAV